MLPVFLLSILILQAQPPAVPVFQVEKEQVDLGDCHYLDPVYHKFIVTNPGGRDLSFDVAKRSCGCLSEVVSHNVVAPGEKAQVVLCYKPSVESVIAGRKSFAVWLSTNDPARKVVELSMLARLRKPAQCDPPQLDFGGAQPGETLRRRLRVICFGKHRIPAVTAVDVSTPDVEIRKISENHAGPRRETTYEACWNAPATAGPLNESVLIATDSTQRPVLEVRVKGEVLDGHGG